MSKGLLVFLVLLGGCQAVPRARLSGPLEPFATVEPLEGGAVFLEIDPVAHHDDGAVMRVNDHAWGTEAVVWRGDHIEIGYRQSPRAGRLAYRTLGRGPRGLVYFETSRWFDDGFPAQTQRVGVRPYRDRVPVAGAR